MGEKRIITKNAKSVEIKTVSFQLFQNSEGFSFTLSLLFGNLNLISVGDGFKGLLLTGIILGP